MSPEAVGGADISGVEPIPHSRRLEELSLSLITVSDQLEVIFVVYP